MDRVIEQVREIATKHGVDKLIVFGSRARGDHSPRSDYDIAVFDKMMSPLDKAYFRSEVDEIATLKKIDIVFVQESDADELMKSILREGVVVYEQ